MVNIEGVKNNTMGNQQVKQVCFCELCQPNLELAVFPGDEEAEAPRTLDLRRTQIDLSMEASAVKLVASRN